MGATDQEKESTGLCAAAIEAGLVKGKAEDNAFRESQSDVPTRLSPGICMLVLCLPVCLYD